MKKLIIGRNNYCDIVIPDTTDVISRKQAVLAISFWGKMILFDTSNNGTYVNGQRLENGKGIRVTRKDKVSFANMVDFDWRVVKDPYHKEKVYTLVSVIVALICAAIITTLIIFNNSEKNEQMQDRKEQVVDRSETDTVQAEPVTEPKTQQQKVRKNKGHGKKGGTKADDEKKQDYKKESKNDVVPIVC